MMNWFAPNRTQFLQRCQNWFTRLSDSWSDRWAALRFDECLNWARRHSLLWIESVSQFCANPLAKVELETTPASGTELALDSDFLEADLLNWRSHGQWKDSANRERNYWTASTAPAEILWQMVVDLAGLASWHPLISSTNAPYGQTAKPGLIYRVCSRYFPLSTQVFVERVQPGELLSIRLFPFPGLQERVTYRIVSTICGTCVLYSITLSGWLSPLAWPMMKPHAVKVAAALVQAAEQETMSPTDSKQRLERYNQQSDLFS